MKCISYKQPWANLVLWKEKRVETRGVNYTVLAGRWHAVHASQTWTRAQDALFDVEPFRTVLARHGVTRGNRTFMLMPAGAIVGVAFVSILARTETVTISDQERAFGDYSPGRWAYHLGDIFPLDEPILFTGRLGVFDLPAEVERQVLIRLQWWTDQLPADMTSDDLMNAAVNRAREIHLRNQQLDANLRRLTGRTVDTRTPIERMIDEATGHDSRERGK